MGDYKGKRLLTMAAPAPESGGTEGAAARHPAGTVAFLEPGVLALGEATAVQRAIDAGASGDDIRKNAELIALIEEMRTGRQRVVCRPR